MKTREFDLGGIRFAFHIEPGQNDLIVVTLFIDGEKVEDSSTDMPQDEVDDFLDRMQRSIATMI
ncbi:hypothetical protein CHL67_11210 [Prosthecochloris sp. GSB1]|uniref:hypothetical protein n=1 Tax=Prosthecochloris sp. GSB1 TaxID=281093 RepID=UPI000B8D1772|nr:hypothetical protein [Prosthecochloris sp. GSB1]ASQ91413.1 hypothetical protein CHL67_11210 [Prosthecochloris sp. GSB1]